jgi:hypothetical protein
VIVPVPVLVLVPVAFLPPSFLPSFFCVAVATGTADGDAPATATCLNKHTHIPSIASGTATYRLSLSHTRGEVKSGEGMSDEVKSGEVKSGEVKSGEEDWRGGGRRERRVRRGA